MAVQQPHDPEYRVPIPCRRRRTEQCIEPAEISAVAEHHVRLEWQLSEQCRAELCSRHRLSNEERACGTHVHDIKGSQFLCEDAGAKRPVSADVDTSQENNERHAWIMKQKAGCATVTDPQARVPPPPARRAHGGRGCGAGPTHMTFCAECIAFRTAAPTLGPFPKS